jgi:hypothetical protein
MNIKRRKLSRFFFSARNYGSACPTKQPGWIIDLCTYLWCFLLFSSALHLLDLTLFLSGRRRCRSGDGNHFSPVFLIATWCLGLPAAGGGVGRNWRDQETVGRSSRVFPLVPPKSWRAEGGRMMIIAKRGKATQTSYSTAGRALAESRLVTPHYN